MKRFTPYEQWHCELVSSGAFDHLNKLFKLNEQSDWPSCSWFDGFLNATNANNRPIVFKEDDYFSAEERYYEQIIFDTGLVPTRQKNWHDLFGGFIWCLFPKTKSLLNKRHVQEINLHGTKQRSKHRNALTLFDECGVILAVTDDIWPSRLRNHQWQEAFVDLRGEWGKSISPFMFGHANYEMLTKPYIGLTGKWLGLDMSAEVAGLPLNVQYRLVDQKLSELIEQGGLNDNRQLSPLPLLGVPGWYDDNQHPSFYDNEQYFRPK